MKILVLLCVLATQASAASVESIEWMTADSDVVVRGFVTGYRRVRFDRPWIEVTFQITESIKGGAKGTLRFGENVFDPARYLEKDLLLFLVDAKDLVDEEPDLAHFQYTPRLRFGTDNPFVLREHRAVTRRFAVVWTPTEVLAAVRGARVPTATDVVHVEAPPKSQTQKVFDDGAPVTVAVPMDAQLEDDAIAWLADPDSRRRGLTALWSFPSAANALRVRTLLADPDKDTRDLAALTLDRWPIR